MVDSYCHFFIPLIQKMYIIYITNQGSHLLIKRKTLIKKISFRFIFLELQIYKIVFENCLSFPTIYNISPICFTVIIKSWKLNKLQYFHGLVIRLYYEYVFTVIYNDINSKNRIMKRKTTRKCMAIFQRIMFFVR